MSIVVLSIDPGQHHYGFALWRDALLQRAWFEKRPVREQFLGDSEFILDTVVCEHPQIFLPALKSANAMVRVAISAGELVGRINKPVVYYTPPQWKGTIKKEQHHPRILEALTSDERSRLELPRNKANAGDVMDAVGIGLFHLKRIDRGKARRAA